MRHRGPDHQGEWWSEDGRVGLAHRRLSILDLSSAGHQPMHDPQGDRTIVFNGEIYNFREVRSLLSSEGMAFRSGSDTEVILAAYRRWGTDCLARLEGTFAFAIHDRPRNRVFLARDRAGEKPLFYHLSGGTLRFASELKALLADPSLERRIDPEALDCYLAVGFVPGDRCILRGFRKLPPAHAMEFDLNHGELRHRRFWEVPDLEPDGLHGAPGETSLLEELERQLERSVRSQMVSDVPVGVLLSGGLDSSLITAMASRASGRVKTFTVRFPGQGRFDESRHARLVSEHFGTAHTEVEAQPADVGILPRLALQFDEPIVDSSMVPTFLVSALVRRECTVALGGDGGDELFGGYRHHSRILWMERKVGWIPRPVRGVASLGAEMLLPMGMKGRNWLQALNTDLTKGVPPIARYFDARVRRRLMRRQGRWNTVAEGVMESRTPVQPELLQRVTRMDFANYLAEDILVKVDRASMLNSLEVRAPFLDRRLVEFAFGRVPGSLKTTPVRRKILLQDLAARILPGAFDTERKQGFSIPLDAWLRGGAFLDFFREVLLDRDCIFDAKVSRALLRGQARGRNHGERLFALVLLELWRRSYHTAL